MVARSSHTHGKDGCSPSGQIFDIAKSQYPQDIGDEQGLKDDRTDADDLSHERENCGIDPWHKEGLRFKCTGCGKCCTGAPGYVWLSEDDIERMSAFLGLSEGAFLQRYARRVGEKYSLLEDRVNYDCVFLRDKTRCMVYEARPKQCQDFPWWPENLSSKEAWESLASYCEGIDHSEGDVVCIEGMTPLPRDVKTRVDEWLNTCDEKTQAEIHRLLEANPKELIDAFTGELAFGTAGLRGVMGVGPNRLNIYTVRKATQGLATYLGKKGRVVIGHDNRHHSREFAIETARVLAGNGIEAYLTPDLRPTPFVSYCARRKKAQAAVMITASHNPKEYNGYKVYWSDGAQVVPPHDRGIIAEVDKVEEIALAEEDDPLIHVLTSEDDDAYITTISKLQHTPDLNKQHGKDLHIVFSNLHGTGITLLPTALASWGFTQLSYVDEQVKPDGDFPTVAKPNPEEEEALALGIEKLKKSGADILLANDPDADRIGLVVMHRDKPVILNGNQIAAICVDFLLKRDLPKNGAIVKTIVTSELLRAIAEKHNVECFDVLTGFKYIGELIHTWEDGSHAFLFGAEESHGYLIGTHARDKDAIVASCLIAEIALNAQREGHTLIDKLEAIYKEYGFYDEQQLAVNFPATHESMEKMQSLMESLRKSPPQDVSGTRVSQVVDYERDQTGLPKSNVVSLDLVDKTRLIIRPSGTEPKIKLYGMAKGLKGECQKRLANHLTVIQKLLQ